MKRESLARGSCLAILAAIACVLAFGIYIGFKFVEAVRPRYAVQWTSEFIIEHLKNNDNQWPTDWEDLRDEYESMAPREHYAWSFDELQLLVDVRWNISSPDEMETLGNAMQNFVSVKNKHLEFLDEDIRFANQQIREYLRTQENTVTPP